MPRSLESPPFICILGKWNVAHNHWVGQLGFSLVEVLAGAVIVGIALVGLALMFSKGQAFVTSEGDNRVALFLAQQKIEQLRIVGYDSLAVTDTAAACTTTATPENPVPNHPGYKRTWSVCCVDRDNYASPMACSEATSPGKKITVTVETLPTISLVTLVTLQAVLASQ